MKDKRRKYLIALALRKFYGIRRLEIDGDRPIEFLAMLMLA